MFSYNSKLRNEQEKEAGGVREIKVLNMIWFQSPDNDW